MLATPDEEGIAGAASGARVEVMVAFTVLDQDGERRRTLPPLTARKAMKRPGRREVMRAIQ